MPVGGKLSFASGNPSPARCGRQRREARPAPSGSRGRILQAGVSVLPPLLGPVCPWGEGKGRDGASSTWGARTAGRDMSAGV